MDDMVRCDNCDQIFKVEDVLDKCIQENVRPQKYQPPVWSYVFKCPTCGNKVVVGPVDDPVEIYTDSL